MGRSLDHPPPSSVPPDAFVALCPRIEGNPPSDPVKLLDYIIQKRGGGTARRISKSDRGKGEEYSTPFGTLAARPPSPLEIAADLIFIEGRVFIVF